jgi:hypothetical protein
VARRDPDRAERLAEIDRRFYHGENEVQIARALGLTPSQVSRDVHLIRNVRLAQLKRSDEEKRADIIGELDHTMRDLEEGYGLTLEPREIRESSRISGNSVTDRAGLRKEPPQPDPRFMEEKRQCLEFKTRLLGVDKGPGGERPQAPELEIIPIDYEDECDRLRDLLEGGPDDERLPEPHELPRGFSPPQ